MRTIKDIADSNILTIKTNFNSSNLEIEYGGGGAEENFFRFIDPNDEDKEITSFTTDEFTEFIKELQSFLKNLNTKIK